MINLFRPITCLLLIAIPLGSVSWAQSTQPSPGQQVELALETSDGGSIPYLLYLPKDYEASAKQPMILFLHGRGESHGPLSLVAKWGPPAFAERGDELPYILVSPQCPSDDSWSKPTQQQRLVELLEHVLKTYSVDEEHIALTGLSMGGYGSWRLAADQPQRFSAVVPVCGGGDPADADKLKGLPIWVWHGDQDQAVPFQKSVEMVEAIQQAGGTQIRFTSLEHIGHNCWSAAYGTPELFDWIAKQTRAQK